MGNNAGKYISLEAASEGLGKRLGVSVPVEYLLRRAGDGKLEIFWDVTGLGLRGVHYRAKESSNTVDDTVCDMDFDAIEDVPDGVFAFCWHGFQETGRFLIALAKEDAPKKEMANHLISSPSFPQNRQGSSFDIFSAPILIDGDNAWWELLEPDADVPEPVRDEHDYSPASRLPFAEELVVDANELDEFQQFIETTPAERTRLGLDLREIFAANRANAPDVRRDRIARQVADGQLDQYLCVGECAMALAAKYGVPEQRLTDQLIAAIQGGDLARRDSGTRLPIPKASSAPVRWDDLIRISDLDSYLATTNPEYRLGENVAAPGQGGTSSESTSQGELTSGGGKRDQQIAKLLDVIRGQLHFDPMSVQNGGKRKAKDLCLKNYPNLFTDRSFDDVWKEANRRGVVAMKDKDRFKSR